MDIQQQSEPSLLEISLVIILIGIMLAVVSNKLFIYRSEAEYAVAKLNIATLKRALDHEVALKKSEGKPLNDLMNKNPMHYINYSLPNYLGKISNPSLTNIPGGYWFYDATHHVLIYKIYYTEIFQNSAHKTQWVSIRIVPIYSQEDKNKIVDLELQQKTDGY
ncbi:MAG: hypothetical protein JSS53_09215 [Proteobacteria bacterium]|nr:hypothetical protein [Pseudomonadota bacterium]